MSVEYDTLNAHVIPLLAQPGLRHRLAAHPDDPVYATLLACWETLTAQLPANQVAALASGAPVRVSHPENAARA